MCRRFIPVDRDEVARIAKEIERDLADHAGELASLDPLAGYEEHLFPADACVTASHAPAAESALGAGVDRPSQLSLFDETMPAAFVDGPMHKSHAFPSSVVSLIVPSGEGASLAVVHMAWGYEVPWKNGPVFNTRIETAMKGDGGMWGASFARRRCLIPAWGFYESHATETVPSARTGRPVKRQYAFEPLAKAPLLLAGIHEKGRFSLVTTEPNDVVAPVHNRMPLVLEPSEAKLWLCGAYAPLLDRSSVELRAAPER